MRQRGPWTMPQLRSGIAMHGSECEASSNNSAECSRARLWCTTGKPHREIAG
jgi:hypothetical protein